jgi:hypothetical protein
MYIKINLIYKGFTDFNFMEELIVLLLFIHFVAEKPKRTGQAFLVLVEFSLPALISHKIPLKYLGYCSTTNNLFNLCRLLCPLEIARAPENT